MPPHPSLGRVSTVRVILERRGLSFYAHRVFPLIWVNGIPTVVLEWALERQGEVPDLTVTLDPEHLRGLGWTEAEYLYDLAIQHPRGAD